MDECALTGALPVRDLDNLVKAFLVLAGRNLEKAVVVVGQPI